MQIVGGIGYTRGGRGERIERINREVRGITIPGGSEEVVSRRLDTAQSTASDRLSLEQMLDLGVRLAINTALGLVAKL